VFKGSWGQVDAATNGHDVAIPRCFARVGLRGLCGRFRIRSFRQGVVLVLNAVLLERSRPLPLLVVDRRSSVRATASELR